MLAYGLFLIRDQFSLIEMKLLLLSLEIIFSEIRFVKLFLATGKREKFTFTQLSLGVQ